MEQTQIFFGAPFAESMAAVLNQKLPNHRVLRKTALEGHRWTPQELRDIGVIDQLAEGGTQGVLGAAHELAETHAPLAKSGVFGLVKKDLAREIFDSIKDDNRLVRAADMARLAKLRL
jgi:enoyl-CoA hydratase/carnithine racemase